MGKKLIIVGGVAGGASCATRARRLDENADIIIFERGSYVSFANCGLPYYVGRVIRDSENLIVATPEMFVDWFNIDVRINSEVESIDRKKCEIKIRNLITNQTYIEKYDALVLSPGSRPKLPPIKGVDLPAVFTLRNIPDTLSMVDWLDKCNTKRAVVLGGGFIGLEMAENLMNLGVEVHLVEMMSHIIPVFDYEMAFFVQEYMIKMGVKLYLGTAVDRFNLKKADAGVQVYLSSGEIIDADIVIVSTGVNPENQLAVKAGLKIGSNGGIKVNQFMQTSDSNIWAVGDVIETNDFVSNKPIQVPLAGPANRQGRIAAEAIMKSSLSANFIGFRGVQGSSVCGVLGMTVAATGLSENRLKQLTDDNDGLSYEKIHVHAYDHAEYYPGAKKITIKLIFSKDTGRILGAQAFGLLGVEKRIDVIAMAIQNKATVFDLAEAELCYAPQYGSAKDVVNIAGMAASNVINGYFDIVHWDELNSNNPVILDVREDFIYQRLHVDGSINIPLGNLRERIGELEKEREIWLYCSEGKRSYYACCILKQKGFMVKSLSGGYNMYPAYSKLSKD